MADGLSFKDIDRGFNRLAKMAEQPTFVDVGIMGDKASTVREGDRTMVEIASYHEFGTDKIPKRSFISAWLAADKDKHIAVARKIVLARIDGKIPEKAALSALGSYAVGSMRSRISAGLEPPLHPRTIARKGSSKPLIDTGQLRGSISFRQSKS